MLTEERQQAITTYINNNDFCRVVDLCKLTDSSESTIRRDLIDLEKRGVIVRVHGGARSLHDYSRDVEQGVRFNLNVDKKRKIAEYAVKQYVKAGEHIFLDAGTTIYEMVPFLKKIPNLHVVTNGVDTALACIEAHIHTRLVGGEAKFETHAIVGSTTLQELEVMNFSAAFIGANGLTSEGKFTTPDPGEAAVKQAGIRQASSTFILMDDSKIGVANFANFTDVDTATLITNHLNSSKKQFLPKNVRLEEAN
ncbi:DeoR family fructose operon transcriptional repressor [Lactobacillus colini]|uniref:DeoR family fructose operon transcriptional repressor n=1 Tax=Lactobacillus colini TaxID=1819254 RepID=A0ABS4MER0_9LACO|nr:DeoR/GlpR family DNA-binding transcription regulator [Lactobacillus colini]MBP2058139.1 DeoR family fructose operon transcriptional repressor [Lactobacillus colini]